jgi:hypothetical protein
MDRLFDFAAASLVDNKNEKPDVARLDALERELRDATVQSKSEMSSQLQGTGSGTQEQKTMIEKYDPQNKTLNYYGTVLGDYSTLLGQMENNLSSATSAMTLSTLEAKSEGSRLSSTDSYGMISNQFGLSRQSEETYKKAKKNHKLSSDNWL